MLLRSNTRLSELSLAHTRLSSARVHALARGLRACAAPLRCLNMSNNNAGSAALATWVSALSHTPLLEALELNDCALGDMGALALHRTLPALPRLRSLSLRRCGVTRAGWLLLSHALPLCPELRALHLDGNQLEEDRIGLGVSATVGAPEAQLDAMLMGRARVLSAAELWLAYSSALALAGARRRGSRDAVEATVALGRWRAADATENVPGLTLSTNEAGLSAVERAERVLRGAGMWISRG